MTDSPENQQTEGNTGDAPSIQKRTCGELSEAIAEDAPGLYFCPLPFEHVHNDNAGNWLLCCHARAFDFEHTIFNATPEQHWHHPEMEQVRREMLSGNLDVVKRVCSKCIGLEKQGLPSPRNRFNAAKHLLPEKNRVKGKNGRPTLECAARMTQDPAAGLQMEERVLELKLRIFGNYCNLRCYMCAPINSTSRIQELEKIDGGHWLKRLSVAERPALFESDEYHEKFVESILHLLPFVKKIKITGGEPFLLKKHYEFLEKIIETQHAGEINLSYDSNMTVFQLGSHNVLDYLKHFARVGIGVSVDNVGEKNDYIRHGSDFNTIAANIETAREFPNINVHVGCASGMLNAGDVHDVAEYFDDRGIDAKFNLCVITSPTFAQARHLPDELKEIYLDRIRQSRFRERFSTLEQMLEKPRNEAEFQDFLHYIQDLDQHRGTSLLKLWPEFEPYVHPQSAEGQPSGIKKRTPEELRKAIEEDAEDQYFCPLPFEHLYNDNSGHWGLCCRSFKFDHTVGNTTPEEHWKHPLMEEIRGEMLSGDLKQVRKYCWKCLKQEKDGMRSARKQLNTALFRKADRFGKSRTLEAAARMTRSPNLGFLPGKRMLELKLRVFGNYCQLRCYMCSPVNSTSRRQELTEIRDGYWLKQLPGPETQDFFESEEDYDRFIDSAVNLLPYVKKIKITGGEPFLLPRHYKFLEKVVATEHAAKIRLSYDSNMTQFKLGSANVLDYLQQFRAVTLAVSIDNLRERNDYIRYGSHFDEVIANINTARAFPGINVVVSCATGFLNAGDVHDIADFFHQMEIDAKFNMCVINWPTFLQARHLPDKLKEQYLGQIEDSPHVEQFANVIRMIKQPRDEEEFQTFLEYVADLDAHRGTSYLDLWPEFAPYHRNRVRGGSRTISPAAPAIT